MKVKVQHTEHFRGKPALKISISLDGETYETITIYSLLELTHWLFRSEDLRYPPEDGYNGRKEPFSAIRDVYSGQTPETVVKKHGCNQGTFDAVEFVEKPTEEEYKNLRNKMVQKKLGVSHEAS